MYLTNLPEIIKHLPEITGVYYLPFTSSHLDELEDAQYYFNSKMGKEHAKTQISNQAECGPAITAFVYGKPAAVFGCVIMWNGVGEMWSIFSDISRRYPFAMTNAAITFCDICEILFHLHRLQITVKTSDSRAMKWAKYLGFIPEGNMKMYSADKEDFTIMGRT